MINTSELQAGDVLSEKSYYIVDEIHEDSVDLIHFRSGQKVNLSVKYVQDFLATSDQYDEEIKVTDEDAKDGTLGIRSIFEGLGSEVITVVFTKQPKELALKTFNTMKELQRNNVTTALNKVIEDKFADIMKAKASKKATLPSINALKEAVVSELETQLAEVQAHPITQIEPGEVRIARGYKMQFSSRDGKYQFQDIDKKINSATVTSGAPSDGIIRVNINTIMAVIANGKLYYTDKYTKWKKTSGK